MAVYSLQKKGLAFMSSPSTSQGGSVPFLTLCRKARVIPSEARNLTLNTVLMRFLAALGSSSE
jgi:hypothetical protein